MSYGHRWYDGDLCAERRDLGGGLVLRRAAKEDAEAVALFNARVHHSIGEPFEQREPHQDIAACTRDLMSGTHPTCAVTDFTVVEDVQTGSVVSSMCLIPQRWSYEGVEFGAGLPEFVGTHPDYRRRGLVREQFETIHRWSSKRGHLMQAIGGIPYYYRQFGYEMAVSMGAGRRIYAAEVPAHSDKDDAHARSFRLRFAETSDAPFLSRLDRQASERYLLTCTRDELLWRYEVAGRNPQSDESLEIRIVEDSEEGPVGYLCCQRNLDEGSLRVTGYELVGGLSWLEVTPVVLGKLKEIGQEHAASSQEQLTSLVFELGEHHPFYESLPERLLHRLPPDDRRDHYAFYVRVPDLPEFLRAIVPVLERRLANSVAAGHTGRLQVSFYGDGLHLQLERGRMKAIEGWSQNEGESGDAAFPNLTFLQLLFGHRSVEELDYAFADCLPGSGDARVLLKTLFPKSPSDLWPIW
jgi:hypothetical protein